MSDTLMDVDGDSLTASVVSGPANDTLMLNADGSLTYTPNGNVNGNDSFTYMANDGTAKSDTVTVSITVNAANDNTRRRTLAAPMAVPATPAVPSCSCSSCSDSPDDAFASSTGGPRALK